MKKKIAKEQAEVGEAGARLFVTLYGGKACNDLIDPQQGKYMNMAANSTTIKPEALPPTKRAAHFHSLRVYLQFHGRNNLNSEVLKTEYWGWKLENNTFVPVMTAELPATSDIWNVIRCNCKI